MSRALLISTLLACGIFAAMSSDSPAVPPEGENKSKTDSVKPNPEPKPLRLPTRKEAMQMKLKSVQEILEAMSLEDFPKIEQAAKQMVAVSNVTDFLNAYKGKEYQFHVEMMRRPAETIARKAKDRNMDGVMVYYTELTLSCLKCHQAMRDNKFEVFQRLDTQP